MNLSFYRQVVEMFPDKPDINTLRDNSIVPETWPFCLKSILNKTSTMLYFEVSDLNLSILCETSASDVIEKVSAMKPGQIVFLYDSVAVINRKKNLIEIHVKSLYSLKEVNDGVAKKEQKEIEKKKPIKISIKRSDLEKKPVKVKKVKQEYGSKWRTLAERWHNQGKI
ncbi:MAG: hypothetical protein AB7V50_01760 [Vampirovibrionia bacterium]